MRIQWRVTEGEHFAASVDELDPRFTRLSDVLAAAKTTLRRDPYGPGTEVYLDDRHGVFSADVESDGFTAHIFYTVDHSRWLVQMEWIALRPV